MKEALATAGVAFLLYVWERYRTNAHKKISQSEWLERMRKLGLGT